MFEGKFDTAQLFQNIVEMIQKDCMDVRTCIQLTPIYFTSSYLSFGTGELHIAG